MPDDTVYPIFEIATGIYRDANVALTLHSARDRDQLEAILDQAAQPEPLNFMLTTGQASYLIDRLEHALAVIAVRAKARGKPS